ncbi:MAG TPA: MlaD family protein [Stellaceae bacterium]|jgi:phospholipid/cholesterol/gamma-HCH transport system substrate-binding protein|nr:MlaD family protein [Stellaceae bacterium]
METRAHYVAVGTFVLALLTVVFIAGLWLAGLQFREGSQFYRMYVTGSVTGLNKNAAVRLNGIGIGKVQDIDLDPVNPNRVVLTLAIREGTVLHQDSVGSVSSSGITGQAYVLITGGTQDSPVLSQTPGAGYPVIPSRPSVLQQVENRAPEMIDKLASLANRLNSLLTPDNEASLSHTIKNLEAVTDEVAAHRKEIGTMLDDGAAAARKLPDTIEQTRRLVVEMRTLAKPAQGTLANAQEASRKLSQLADDLDQLVRRNQGDIHNFASSGLPQLLALTQQMRELVANLSRLTNGVSQDPTALLYGDRRQGYSPP